MGAAYLLVYVELELRAVNEGMGGADRSLCRHLKFTIPTALVLAYVHAPLRTRVDVYKLAFITTVRNPRIKAADIRFADNYRLRSPLRYHGTPT